MSEGGEPNGPDRLVAEAHTGLPEGHGHNVASTTREPSQPSAVWPRNIKPDPISNAFRAARRDRCLPGWLRGEPAVQGSVDSSSRQDKYAASANLSRITQIGRRSGIRRRNCLQALLLEHWAKDARACSGIAAARPGWYAA
jgi:hypothetical protein